MLLDAAAAFALCELYISMHATARKMKIKIYE